MGTLSVLISRCCCVLEAEQGSTVIGLFLYWGIQSRTEGCGSQQSDPRIPPPASHPFFLLSRNPPPPPSWHRCLHWKDLWILAAPGNWRGAMAPPFQRCSKSVLTKTKWRNPESSAVPWMNSLLGTCQGKLKEARTQNEAEKSQSLEVMPGFFSPAEPGTPKCSVPSQTERGQLRK